MAINVRIKTVPREPSQFLLKNIVMYGANKSGKTTLLLDIMSQIRPYIPNVVAFAPTADSNNSLKGVVPDILINRRVELSKIKEVYSRQKDAAIAYNNANDPEVLQSLFKRVAGTSQIAAEKKIYELQQLMDDKLKKSSINAIEQSKQVSKITDMSVAFRISLYKSVIRSTAAVLVKMNLTSVERQAIKFRDFNPHMLMIFDDCASIFTKKFQNDPMIKDLFYMYRHSFITIVFTFQDDLGLESFLRKNASLSFFTTQQCGNAYFERGSNSFSRDVKNDASEKAAIIFDKNQHAVPEFSKLLYIRDDIFPIRYYTAQMHEKFRFGSKALWTYCEKIDQIRRADQSISSTFGCY
jgi:hypothetical protein